ncbi:HAMP domain-containing protein [Undibacterium sp. LX40W]|uniref:histidine kinase n=1 Tax=Undibacterium nitidum TaxID=2762298 RepID=A0A923HL30_9BURK|nr:ATP-binding protein [Undibacterium nitidum]MBC3881022.1 HAMP domain-containing protein [Undibacterium nitidum]MBC3890245.1 HAMP domain-containing protein [Undibacterium sp. LX40W]
MKFPIGLRLFLALLTSTFAVAAITLLLLSGSVLNVFSDYTVKIDLDRLEEVSNDITDSYAKYGDWSFLPDSEEDRRYWFGTTFNRLHQERITKKVNIPAPTMELVKSNRNQPSAIAPIPPVAPVANAARPAPPAPPAAPAAPPPPPLPPLPTPLSEPSNPDPSYATDPALLAKNGDLYLRVTLLDRQSGYLAGLKGNSTEKNYRALFSQGELIGYLLVKRSNSRPDEVTKQFLNAYRDNIIRFVLLSIALSAITAIALAIHFKRPLIRLRDGTQLLAQGKFDTRLSIKRSDELGELTDNFNLLAEKLERIEEDRRQWVADTSHELRTPISVIRAQIEAFQDGIRTPSPENLSLLLRQILSLDKLINDLYELTQLDTTSNQLQLDEVDIKAMLDDLSHSFDEKFKRAHLHFEFKYETPELVLAKVDAQRLNQVFINLLENSVRYTAEGGRIELKLHQDHEFAYITLDDSAPGLDVQQMTKLGQRFYRPDSARSRQHGGSGLGLSLCARVIEAHGGHILFSTSLLGGLAIKITLPKKTKSQTKDELV